jgi:hypothetical protein
MNRRIVNVCFSKAFGSLGIVAGICLVAPTEASAQEVVVYPDAAYIAAAEPVYFNGVGHYWYRDRWYYRNGRSWAWYHGAGEPAYLHDYRFRVWPGGVYHPGYHYSAGYGGGWHGGWHGEHGEHGGGHRR